MPTFVNFSAYRFLPLTDLKPLRARLLARSGELDLRGTILLSTEGINLFVAGAPAAMDEFLLELRAIPGLHDLDPKRSDSDHQPFTRMLVRIKKEIIAFGVEGIDPGQRTSPKLKAAELKRWLDEGRPVTLLDTRNDYEVKLGTFRNAVQLDLENFRQFPAAVDKLPAEMKQQPIVMFCTGGIRCEKAGPFMEREGFEQIFQLDGGILKYFEEVGGDHYDGECFVFDQRVGVDPSLAETENTQCFRCLTPLVAADQDDPRYIPGQSCPYCYKTDHERMGETIARREAAIHRATNPLPGKELYDNYRPLTVTAAHEGLTLLDFLSTVFAQTPRDEWQTLIEAGQFLDGVRRVLPAMEILHAGGRYVRLLAATSEPDVAADIRVLYEDEALVVVNKPAPLPLHPSGRYNRNTLQKHLESGLHAAKRFGPRIGWMQTPAASSSSRGRGTSPASSSRNSLAAKSRRSISPASKVTRRKTRSFAMRRSATRRAIWARVSSMKPVRPRGPSFRFCAATPMAQHSSKRVPSLAARIRFAFTPGNWAGRWSESKHTCRAANLERRKRTRCMTCRYVCIPGS
jgi:UPF0176 protein